MVFPVPGRAGQDDVLAGVDGRHQLVDHVVGEDHPLVGGRLLQLFGGEGTHGAPVGVSGPLLEGGVGDELAGGTAIQLSDECGEGYLAHELDDLVAQLDVHRSMPDEGVVGARCTTSGTRRHPRPSPGASTPATTLVAWSFSSISVLQAQRQLPAHIRLPVHEPLAPADRGLVQGAAGPLGPSGPVEEDAGVVVRAGSPTRRPRCGGWVRPAASDSSLNCHSSLVHGGGQLGYPLAVGLVGEVGAVAAAALLELGCRTGQHPLAAAGRRCRSRGWSGR